MGISIIKNPLFIRDREIFVTLNVTEVTNSVTYTIYY